jgi:hypothetical protein
MFKLAMYAAQRTGAVTVNVVLNTTSLVDMSERIVSDTINGVVNGFGPIILATFTCAQYKS